MTALHITMHGMGATYVRFRHLTSHSPSYSVVFLPIPSYLGICRPITSYSILFRPIPPRRIPPYSVLFRPIPAFSETWQGDDVI